MLKLENPEMASFLLKNSDIQFTGKKLVFGNSVMENFGTEIKNMDFDKVNSKSLPIKFLADWDKTYSRKKFETRKPLLEKGIESNGYLYASEVPFNLNSVYALRSIAYYYENKKRSPYFGTTDMIIAFKVVEQEKDGSIVTIWKKLR